MPFERQDRVVSGTRGAATAITVGFNTLDELQPEFDVLDTETPNFEDGYFSTAREIDRDTLLGIYNANTALKNAAPAQYAALRAAFRKGRS